MLETPIIPLVSDMEVSIVPEISTEYMNALMALLTSNSYIIITVALAYLSGNIWLYIILSYFSKRERNFLNNTVGKVGLGILWFSLILLGIYIFVYRSIITIENMNEILITNLVISLALQAIVLLIINVLHRKE